MASRPASFKLLHTLAGVLGFCAVAYAGMFDGKVCYITGGTSGLGLASARAAAKEGCKVVITGRRAEKGDAVVKEIKDAGGEASFFKCDMMHAEQVEASIKFTIDKYGSIDNTFNNAGVAFASDFLKPHELTVDDWQTTMKINLDGTFYAMKYEVEQMLKLNITGSIVNCGSIFGVTANPTGPAYASAKHALSGLSKTFALAYAANNIRINILSPGYSPSEMTAFFGKAEELGSPTVSKWHPAGRWLKNEEVTDGLFFLWSNKSTFYNGQNLVLDSGLSAGFSPPADFKATLAAAQEAVGKATKKDEEL